ncbi:ABC transporter ATP-binding protein [Actinospica durhamensis]|uniref:ABC transporter ATP-binding protein n=1 Tax=Actinospica durhamensis TaxID=1508375 RepID=A0A941EJA7_9ACTN|nr:ABC transporter ATP-binding protein [Actinospica durhamensis]MBR7831790.1 ABC transporter ATP-binding protein [Actinospica durhamensis]
MTSVARALWREVMIRSWQVDRRMTVGVALLVLGQMIAAAAISLALRQVISSVVEHSRTMLLVSVAVVAAAVAMRWIGMYATVMLRGDLADRIGYQQFDPEIQSAAAGLGGVEHLERPEYLDRLSLVVGKGQVLADACWGVNSTVAITGQAVLSLVLLALVSPWLLLLGLFALPAVRRGSPGRISGAAMAAAGDNRLERHLHAVTTRASSGREIRVTGAQESLLAKADSAWQRATAVQLRARWAAAVRSAPGSLVFLVGFGAALVFTAHLVATGRRTVADFVLVASLAGQLQASIAQSGRDYRQTQAGLALAEPLAWLREYCAGQTRTAAAAQLPERLVHGLTLTDVEFGYGSGAGVLGPISVELPAGAMVALVGTHGCGKTTLVKLLHGFYPPSAGEIRVDGVPLRDLDLRAWHARSTAAFQDFHRYQVTLRHAVGFGDLEACDDDARLLTAIEQADGTGVYRMLSNGLDTQLGTLFEAGRELSEGQWQKVALARACMRTDPLLVVLDEPTASLDPPSEHAVFQRHAALARELGAAHGTVTIVVSHRFSTVRMADLILVMEDGRIVEQGDHSALMESDGRYARLYRMQEQAYRLDDEPSKLSDDGFPGAAPAAPSARR